MSIPRTDLPPVGSGPDRRLPLLLEAGWARGMAGGAIAYDPESVETLTLPPLCFHLLPGRETRPRAAPSPGERQGLDRPHRPCPFDEPEFLAERGVVEVAREGRRYYLAFNKYPVLRLHYLAVRPAEAPTDLLPQRLFGADEIEDMLRLASLLGPPFRLFFNSNRGSDGSRSGSSVNHWHFQIFPSDWGATGRAAHITSRRGAVEVGHLSAWPARHRLYRSSEGGPLARELWQDLAPITARDIAYNVEVVPEAGGSLLVLLFPRAPTADLGLPGGRMLSGDFGGFELSGNVVVPDRAVFRWIADHPRQAVELVLSRIRDGTADPP